MFCAPMANYKIHCAGADPERGIRGLSPHSPSNEKWKKNKEKSKILYLKVDMPILTCIFYTFDWLTLTSEMHFVKFYPEVASCLLSRGKRNYAPLGMRLFWKYTRNYLLVYHLISHFLLYLQNCKEFEAEILDLQSEKYGLSFDIKKYNTSSWALGDENVIGIRAFNKELETSIIKIKRVWLFDMH